MGMAHVVVCLNIFFIASCALTISLFCLSPLTFDLKEPPRRSHWQAMVCVAYGQCPISSIDLGEIHSLQHSPLDPCSLQAHRHQQAASNPQLDQIPEQVIPSALIPNQGWGLLW